MTRRDPSLRLRPVLIVAGVTILIIAALFPLTWAVYQASGERETPPLDTATAAPPPALDLGHDRRVWLAPMRARLASYGWVDRETGVVHIPIDRAAAHLLAEGLPTREELHP
ncbi:MAG: hypothetical protein H6705_21300 [Myxococcales bacterium]|nr:hypothetical protein [Myxococcales bacterium]